MAVSSFTGSMFMHEFMYSAATTFRIRKSFSQFGGSIPLSSSELTNCRISSPLIAA